MALPSVIILLGYYNGAAVPRPIACSTWIKIRVEMLRSEVGPGKRSLIPIFIIKTDFEVVDLYSGDKF